jgi:O-acetyl-ADP-ribose deacetylase (regulator of RNase III)
MILYVTYARRKMKVVKGDLIKLAIAGEFDVIVHGCNCFCTMGAGIAATIKKIFPEAYTADRKSEYASKEKLGTYTSATIKYLTIVNAYTQYDFKGRRNADYDAIRNVFKLIKQDFPGKKIGYPLIGAGLAGGDWNIISQIINEELEGEDHTLVEYVP